MQITKVKETKGKRYLVFGDEQFLFSLYGNELKQYHIEEGSEIHENILKDIMGNVIYKRAKERALYLLERRPYSIYMLKDKLIAGDYPMEIIEKVVSFLEEYHYLNDIEYTRLYINSYIEKKSKKQIVAELFKKGISKETMQTCFNENEYSETKCFLKQFERYVRGKNMMDYTTRHKVFCYFYNKGFSAELINLYIREAELYTAD